MQTEIIIIFCTKNRKHIIENDVTFFAIIISHGLRLIINITVLEASRLILQTSEKQTPHLLEVDLIIIHFPFIRYVFFVCGFDCTHFINLIYN